jgi:hypothetical protein
MAEPRKNAQTTRGKPFPPGNPGRPKGARHKVTTLAEKLMSDDAEGVVKAIIDAAKAGDMAAAKIVLDRLAPPRRDRPVSFSLPEIKTAGDAAKAVAAIVAAVAAGILSPPEGEAVSSLVERYVRIVETTDFERRLAAVERQTAQ